MKIMGALQQEEPTPGVLYVHEYVGEAVKRTLRFRNTTAIRDPATGMLP